MVTNVISFDISKPYAYWKSAFDKASDFLADAGFELVYVGHTVTDESKCILIIRTPTVEALEAFMGQEALQPVMIESGHILESTKTVSCAG